MKLLMYVLVLIVPILLGGCYTVRGFGQDMSAAGRALSNAADTVLGSEPAEPAPVSQLPAPAQGSSTMPQPQSLTPGQPEEPK